VGGNADNITGDLSFGAPPPPVNYVAERRWNIWYLNFGFVSPIVGRYWTLSSQP